MRSLALVVRQPFLVINIFGLLTGACFMGFFSFIPYYATVQTSSGERRWLVVPYSLTVNDSKFWRGGLTTGDDFFQAMKETFDTLYEEGAETPKLMNVGLHCRIVGQPGRANGLDRFVAYAKSHSNVWFAGRSDIARTWLDQFPPEQCQAA